MFQKKEKKSGFKQHFILSEKRGSLSEKPATSARQNRQIVYPVLSFILSIVACIIYFFVGFFFMQLAVTENFHNIRGSRSKPTGIVVATIGEDNIYMSEIKDYAKAIPQLAELPFEVVYPQLLETVVDSRVLKTAATKAGIPQRATIQQAIELAADQIIAQTYLDERLQARATDARLRELYQEELKNFKPVTEVHARHILVKSEQEARDILIQLRAGASFAMSANKYSLDKSSTDGDLGYFTEEMMIPEFGKAVFALKKGQISEPIKTPFGWHIVLVEDRRLSEPPPFEDVKDELHNLLMKNDISQVLAEERAKLNVQIKKPKI